MQLHRTLAAVAVVIPLGMLASVYPLPVPSSRPLLAESQNGLHCAGTDPAIARSAECHRPTRGLNDRSGYCFGPGETTGRTIFRLAAAEKWGF